MSRALTLFALLADGGAAVSAAHLEAHVRQYRGSPALVINDEPRVPMVFWGHGTQRGAKVVTLGPEWREYRLTFVAPEDNEAHMGVHFRVGGGPPGTVWVDDVRLYRGPKEEEPAQNMLRFGDWEGTRKEMEGTWVLFQRADEGTDVEWDVDGDSPVSGDQSCRITIRNGGKTFMHAHFYQTGMSVKQGETYTYSLWMKSAEKRQVDFQALHHGEPWTVYSQAGNQDYESQVRRAAAAGIHIHSWSMPMPWPRPGEEPDWRAVDAGIEMTLRNDPEALLMPRFGCAPPGWWLEEHPDDVMRFSDGGTRSMSMASEAWLADCLANVRALVRHCEEGYGDRFIGYHPCGQHTGEWFYERSWEPVLSDFSPAMDGGFRKWVTAKYGNEGRLRQAWGDPALALDQVSVPSAGAQLATRLGFFRDPETEREVIDYLEYKQVAMERPLEAIARAIKDETRDRKLVVLFYGYTFDMHGIPTGPQTSGHLAMGRMVRCPDVDILTSPISYLDRQLGGAGLFMSAVDTVRQAGKLWLNEDDTRTYLTPESAGYGRVDTQQGTYWVHQRNFAQLLPRRLACWYMDLGGSGWLDAPDIWDNIAALREVYEEALPRPSTWSPETAVIVDEKGPFYTRCDRSLHSPLVYQMRSECARLGAPARIHLLSDLTAGNVPPAKAYLFLNCFHLDAQERQAVHGACAGSAAIWFYGGGFLSDVADDAQMADIIGLPIERGTAQPGQIRFEAGDLTRGLEMSPFGPETALDPLWTVQEVDGLYVIGRYADGSVAAALREGDAGIRCYIGALHTPAALLRRILIRAGVHIYMDTDDVILADQDFLAVSATTAGTKTIRLPAARTVVDALTGDTLAQSADEFSLVTREGETRLFWLRD